jgi:hypothetical protein
MSLTKFSALPLEINYSASRPRVERNGKKVERKLFPSSRAISKLITRQTIVQCSESANTNRLRLKELRINLDKRAELELCGECLTLSRLRAREIA